MHEPDIPGIVKTLVCADQAILHQQSLDVLMSMAGALMGMGGRSKKLHSIALKLAKKIGPIDFDPDGRCDPFDVAKNLSNPAIKKRLGF